MIDMFTHRVSRLRFTLRDRFSMGAVVHSPRTLELSATLIHLFPTEQQGFLLLIPAFSIPKTPNFFAKILLRIRDAPLPLIQACFHSPEPNHSFGKSFSLAHLRRCFSKNKCVVTRSLKNGYFQAYLLIVIEKQLLLHSRII